MKATERQVALTRRALFAWSILMAVAAISQVTGVVSFYWPVLAIGMAINIVLFAVNFMAVLRS